MPKAAKKSTKLTAASRRKIPAAKMGLPDKGKFPVNTKARAGNAKARAAQGLQAGTLSQGDAKKVVAKADAALGGGKKAAAKGAGAMIAEAKKAAGGKMPFLKAVAKKPNPAMGKGRPVTYEMDAKERKAARGQKKRAKSGRR